MIDNVKLTRVLFEPYRSDAIELRNRLVMAPMTRAKATAGVLSDESVAYYRRRAESGVGLIISEGTWIGHPAASDRQAVPRFHGEDALAKWKEVADAVHAAGGKMFPQLWHVGAVPSRAQAFNPELPSVSPSGITLPASSAIDHPSVAMTAETIDSVIDAYASGAEAAKTLGFDGAELHGGHGFLIDQFFWTATNHRTDKYNGSIADRARFAKEIIQECRVRTGPDFPLSFRFSQWKMGDFAARLVSDEKELAIFLEGLVDAGVDIFSVSTRKFWEPAFPGGSMSLAGWTKKISGKTTIAVGGAAVPDLAQPSAADSAQPDGAVVTSIAQLTDLLENEHIDLIAIGRAILAEHDWAGKVKRGQWAEMAYFSEDKRNIMY